MRKKNKIVISVWPLKIYLWNIICTIEIFHRVTRRKQSFSIGTFHQQKLPKRIENSKKNVWEFGSFDETAEKLRIVAYSTWTQLENFLNVITNFFFI